MGNFGSFRVLVQPIFGCQKRCFFSFWAIKLKNQKES